MKNINESKYEEWLSTIANTRLIFNTMKDLENYLDNHNISTNGMKRSYSSTQKMRTVFNDLYMYVNNISDGLYNLDELMTDYKKASDFYKKRLSRKNEPKKIVTDILKYFYHNNKNEAYTKSMLGILEDMSKNDINVTITILLIMKALHSYESKDGDIKDIYERYADVMNLLKDFTEDCLFLENIPAITNAKNEENKTRLSLIKHTETILDIYDSYNSEEDIYDLNNIIKNQRVDLKIAGFWNESDGKPDRTDFWDIEKTNDYGLYFATHYNKRSDGKIDMIKYSIQLIEGDDGRLIVYVVHPEAASVVREGKKLNDSCHSWYVMDMPIDWNIVNNMPLKNLIRSESRWKPSINLTKISDKNVIENYESLLKNYEIINNFKKLEYEFYPCLYAITQEGLYIPAEEQYTFYKIPFSVHKDLIKAKLNDNIGKMYFEDEIYLAFDELLLYISVKDINSYGITIVDSIE